MEGEEADVKMQDGKAAGGRHERTRRKERLRSCLVDSGHTAVIIDAGYVVSPLVVLVSLVFLVALRKT